MLRKKSKLESPVACAVRVGGNGRRVRRLGIKSSKSLDPEDTRHTPLSLAPERNSYGRLGLQGRSSEGEIIQGALETRHGPTRVVSPSRTCMVVVQDKGDVKLGFPDSHISVCFAFHHHHHPRLGRQT
jgi:hypothetical protein